ncbi:MAG: thioredoxin domain-containing protein [Nitrospinae bacterium]|nr:thioredoxin domain-containing protein [Nitrospinota bacterium]
MKIISRTMRNLIFIWSALSLLAAATPVWADFDNNPAIATLDGKPVLMEDIENAQIHELRVQLHQLQSQALKEKIIQQFSEAHPESAKDGIRPVTQADISAFYKSTSSAREMGSLKEMQGQLRSYLERIARFTAIEKKYQAALAGGWAKVLLTPPNDFKVVAQIGNAALWFGDDAPGSRKVFILEFSDFQCPFCKRVQPTLDKLRQRYGKDVQFGYRHFPLPFHKEAQTLAEATECARDQGKFWELQKLFYEKDSPNIKSKVLDHAKTAGVEDMQEFKKCWESEKHRQKVLKDIDEGSQAGIQATPGFIIGSYDEKKSTVTGEVVSGALPEEQFIRLIAKYLTQAQTASAQ